jgi:predicted transporter
MKVRRAFAIAVAVMLSSSSPAFACPVCFGAEETSIIDANKIGVLVLLGITLLVQGAFAAFFFYLRKRAKLIADADLDNEWSELQGSPKTS